MIARNRPYSLEPWNTGQLAKASHLTVAVTTFVTLLAYSIAATCIAWLGAGSDRGWWPVFLAFHASASAIFAFLFGAAVSGTRLASVRFAVTYASFLGATLVVLCVLFYGSVANLIGISQDMRRVLSSPYATYGMYVSFLLVAVAWARLAGKRGPA